VIRRGRIIAQGTLEELSHRFVGDARMELKVAGEMNGLAKEIGDMVSVEESGRDWLRFRVADPQTTNPALVRRMTGLGVDIISIAPISQTLEQIYLQIMEEDEKKELAQNGNRRTGE
jgi:ABC-type multidrug transport system ATPase subunit